MRASRTRDWLPCSQGELAPQKEYSSYYNQIKATTTTTTTTTTIIMRSNQLRVETQKQRHKNEGTKLKCIVRIRRKSLPTLIRVAPESSMLLIVAALLLAFSWQHKTSQIAPVVVHAQSTSSHSIQKPSIFINNNNNNSIVTELVRQQHQQSSSANSYGGQQQQQQQAQQQSDIPKKFVMLNKNNTRAINHGQFHVSQASGRHLGGQMATTTNNFSDLSAANSMSSNSRQQLVGLVSDNNNNNNGGSNQQPSSQKKGLFEKICIGTSNRMSGQHNKTDHYQNLAERYRNCTYVIGNLEITWLEKGQNGKQIDLTFLESIREITGYLLIAYVEVEKIRMPNLQIIRGRDLFRLNNGQKEEFAMFLIENELKSLELPNLREILAGSVGSYNNRNLCHIRTINWDEILNWPTYRSVFVYNGTEPECAPCDSTCSGSCWAEGPEMCQKFSKTTCSPQCSLGRCFGPLPRECCHLFCAGGCTGPKQTDCLACRNFYDDGECIQECPSMMRYNPSKFLWETNPNGKYAFGGTCVKECPEHLLRDNGACVRTCPPNKRSVNGECVPCGGPCPKNCQGVEKVHSGNIDQFVNCTVIEGSLSILDTSFAGFAEVHNNTIGNRYKPMHPSRLEVFSSLREITGFLSIEASHPDFKNLSYFRNLRVIGGRQTTDMFQALSIIRTSLVSFNLRSLRKIRSGKITIEQNSDLCFVETIDWEQIQPNITRKDKELTKYDNADSFKCLKMGLICHEQCARDGCWGPGPDECLSCKNYKLDDYCVDNCTSTQSVGFLSFDSGDKTCKKCHPECKGGCSGTEARHCWQCKNVKDGPYCVSECPSHKYNNNGNCEECDKSCIDGCTGPYNTLGFGGCNSCGKTVINSTSPYFIGHCIKTDEPCPEGYYQDYVGSQAEGPLKPSSGKLVCRKCHSRCKSCTGMGTHKSVCECAKYEAGELCEDSCSRDYYADEQLRQCVKCSPQCNGCFGPTEADCITCRVYRIYSDSYTPTAQAAIVATNSKASTIDSTNSISKQLVRFNCTAQCPPDKPHRISESNMLDPYCSEDPGIDPENPRIVSVGSTSVLFILIISAAIMFCVSVYRCQIEKDKTVKLTMRLSGFDDVEPLNQSNVKPNLAPLRSIKETELRKGGVLGSGFGGTVYQGFWFPEGQDHKEPRPVAIKVLHDNCQSTKEFLDEAYIMASVNHPNLVRLLAVCMTPNSLMLVTQLMPLGCLLEYVQKNKNDIGSKNLLEWCKQIARGMAYLEERRMVHRDLALRNVLLQTSGRALISDFGLAKFLEVDQSEYHSGGGRLPIKWLAPECIRERKFTHKSDVWAFGVTVWELLTFGMKPFEEYDTKAVPMAIEEGARLKQPSHVTAEVYKLMYSCWFYNPDDRPNFKTLAEEFVNFARDPQRFLPIRGREGIVYSTRQDLDRNSGSDENEDFISERNSLTDEVAQSQAQAQAQPQIRLTISDLTTSSQQQLQQQHNNGLNEAFGFEMRHHSESETTSHGQTLLTPTLKRPGMFLPSESQIEEDIFSNSIAFNLGANSNNNIISISNGNNNNNSNNLSGSNNTMGGIKRSSNTPQLVDSNNNNFIQTSNGRLSMNAADSACSVNHTLSTNSLGQRSEQPTDHDDYLLPSPCSNDEKFNKFLASRDRLTTSRLPPPPTGSRDPPHSAGLIGISNDEYFRIRLMDYANPNGVQSATNASSCHIPQSLV